MKIPFIVGSLVIYTTAIWQISYNMGYSEGSSVGHTLGVLNCETREMCDRFLPGAKRWWDEQKKKGVKPL